MNSKTKKSTKIINIFGGPGIGKSTVIAGLFHKMKINHINVEVANEFAKDLVWNNQSDILIEDQLYIFAHQHRRIYRLINRVDYIIADCPLLMCIPYIAKEFYTNLEPLIVEAWNSFDNQSFVLNRPKDLKYESRGRYQDEEGSFKKHKEIVDVLIKYDVRYTEVDVDEHTVDTIYETLPLVARNG